MPVRVAQGDVWGETREEAVTKRKGSKAKEKPTRYLSVICNCKTTPMVQILIKNLKPMKHDSRSDLEMWGENDFLCDDNCSKHRLWESESLLHFKHKKNKPLLLDQRIFPYCWACRLSFLCSFCYGLRFRNRFFTRHQVLGSPLLWAQQWSPNYTKSNYCDIYL